MSDHVVGNRNRTRQHEDRHRGGQKLGPLRLGRDVTESDRG